MLRETHLLNPMLPVFRVCRMQTKPGGKWLVQDGGGAGVSVQSYPGIGVFDFLGCAPQMICVAGRVC